MEWIFLDLGMGSALLLSAQLLEYLLTSRSEAPQNLHIGAFSNDPPFSDRQAVSEISAWYDQAA